MKIFVIADTHFGHANMVKFEGRPENFDEIIIANWNATVRPEDMVLHLGDVSLGRSSAFEALVTSLNGRKILCLGNHDREKPDWYMARGFDFACAYYVLKGVCFSHKPVTPLPPGCTLNIHGHFHRTDHRDFEYAGNDYYHRHRHRYRLVQIEDTLAPVALDEFLGGP